MIFTSFDAVFFTVAFLIPGFIWEMVLHLFLRRREDRADRAWVRFLTLSALNYAFWSWLIYLLSVRAGLLAQPWMAALRVAASNGSEESLENSIEVPEIGDRRRT